MWAARPHLANIFEKLLHRKTFWLPAALSLQSRLFYFNAMFHVKHSEFVLRKTTRNQFGKAGAHPQLAFGIAIAPETLYFITTFSLSRQLRFFRCFLDFCFILWCSFDLLRKCGLLAHTSAAFLKNCCTEKFFSCLRLVACSQYCFILMRCFM